MSYNKGAQEETGAHGGTLHKFLMAYGYSFETDEETGVTTWGERDKNKPVPGEWLLGHNDVLVVDEAGMMTQDVALRLNQIVRETGVRVRMVGDYRQLAAVGRGGILQMTEQNSYSTDLRDIFRFKTDEGELDKAYAELTLQIREGRDPQVAFDELVKRGLVVLHESMEEAQEALAEAWVDSYESGEKCVIATARNEDVTSINRHVGILRAETEPEIESWDDTAEEDILTGRDGLKISVDDVIATRKNNADLGVLNRQTWRVQEITEGYLVAVSTEDKTHRVALPLDYVNEYVDMAYAITGHGSQGMTVDRSHTLVTEATNAGGLYVGVSRGKYSNEVHFVAADLDEAYEQFAGALKKDRADNGLDSARAELVEQLREAGLLPQFEREGLNVRASDVKPGQVLSFGASEKLVLDSQRTETGEYKFRVLDKGTKKPQWTTPVPERIHFPYLDEVSLYLPRSVQKQIQAVRSEAQKIESAMDYVHEVREWELDHVREFSHIESSENFVQAYTDQLHAVEQELAQAQRAYEESVQIRENHLAQPAQVLTQAQEAFDSAGIFARTFGKVTGNLEEAQLAWDKACEAYPVPSDAEVEQLQARVRVIQSQIDENARYRDETRAGLMSSLPVAPSQAQKFLRGSGVDVELAEGVEARFREDRADLVRLYSLEPEYRANLVNAELQESVRAGAVKRSVRVQQESVHQVDFLEQQRLMGVTVGGVQDGAEM